MSIQMAKRLPNVYSLCADANLKEILVAASGFLVMDDAVYEFEVQRHALLRDCLKAVEQKDISSYKENQGVHKMIRGVHFAHDNLQLETYVYM